MTLWKNIKTVTDPEIWPFWQSFVIHVHELSDLLKSGTVFPPIQGVLKIGREYFTFANRLRTFCEIVLTAHAIFHSISVEVDVLLAYILPGLLLYECNLNTVNWAIKRILKPQTQFENYFTVLVYIRKKNTKDQTMKL